MCREEDMTYGASQRMRSDSENDFLRILPKRPAQTTAVQAARIALRGSSTV